MSDNKPKPKVKSFQLSGGSSTPASTQQTASVVGVLIFGGLMAFYFFGGLDWVTQRKIDDVYEQTAQDFERQYRLMGSESSETDKCVKAGTVAAAWLQAENQANYKSWKAVENRHCEAAGIPR